MTTMHVIMGNDFPAGICSSAEKAEEVLRQKKEAEGRQGAVRIYWRSYEFEIDALLKEGDDAGNEK